MGLGNDRAPEPCPKCRRHVPMRWPNLRKAGVEFHSLSDDQLGEWKEAGGYQRPEWDEFKIELAGSMDAFAKMEEAAGTQGKYYVHDA